MTMSLDRMRRRARRKVRRARRHASERYQLIERPVKYTVLVVLILITAAVLAYALMRPGA